MGDKTYTEEEFNAAMAGLRNTEESKFKKKLEDERRVAMESAIKQFKDENGLSDDVLAKLPGIDAQALEMKQMKKRLGELEAENSKLASDVQSKNREYVMYRAKGDVVAAAAEFNANGPSDIWDSLQGKLEIGEDGSYGFVENGKRTTKAIKDHVKEYLDTRPWLVKASNPEGGSGSRPGRTDSMSPAGDESPPDVNSSEFKSRFAEAWSQRAKA